MNSKTVGFFFGEIKCHIQDIRGGGATWVGLRDRILMVQFGAEQMWVGGKLNSNVGRAPEAEQLGLFDKQFHLQSALGWNIYVHVASQVQADWGMELLGRVQ